MTTEIVAGYFLICSCCCRHIGSEPQHCQDTVLGVLLYGEGTPVLNTEIIQDRNEFSLQQILVFTVACQEWFLLSK